jgi:hypothetical protein
MELQALQANARMTELMSKHCRLSTARWCASRDKERGSYLQKPRPPGWREKFDPPSKSNGRGSTPAHACAPRSPPHPLYLDLPGGATMRCARTAPRVMRLVLLLGVMTCGLPGFTHGAWDLSTPLIPPPACTLRLATSSGLANPRHVGIASGRTRLRHTGRPPVVKGAISPKFPPHPVPSNAVRVCLPNLPYMCSLLQREATGRRRRVVIVHTGVVSC